MGVQIPKALVENYARAIGTLSDSACKAVARQMSQFSFSDDVASDRERIQDLLKACLRPYMDVSVRTAVEFYQIVREWSLGERTEADVGVDDVERPDATDGAVRAFMQEAVDGRPENVAALLVERTAYELKRSAIDAMAQMGRRDKADARFARVPGFSRSYGDGCMFCKMLSSLGFHYLSEEAAGTHVHANCTCTVLPGFKGTTVEGYDPDAIGAQWESEMGDIAERRAARNGTTPSQEYDKMLEQLGEASKRAKRKNKATRIYSMPRRHTPGEATDTKKSVGAVYSSVYAARDAEVAKANLDKLKQNQLTHMEGTPQNRQVAKSRGREPSCFTLGLEEVKRLIKEHAGKGEVPVSDMYEWHRKELCTSDDVIGYVVNAAGEKVPTKSFKIHYSDNGLHAVPTYHSGR